MHHLSVNRHPPKGFSLIELMIFATLAMVLLTIVYSAFNGMNPRIKEIIHARNAKSIVATANNALLAGAAFKAGTRNGMVAEMIHGIQPSRGIFKGKTFVVPNLQVGYLEDAALKYISLSTYGTLTFDDTGTQPPR